MANLHFHYGTMGSSKSAKLIIDAYNFRKNNIPVEVLKPTLDTRFSQGEVKSRIGISTPATRYHNLVNYEVKENTKVILVDEVQFFRPEDIDILVNIADSKDIIVMCYGLMVDYNESLFPASRRLVEVGAKLHVLESTCQIEGCMNLANHHLLFNSRGEVVRGGSGIQLGDTEFKSVCRKHFNLFYKNIDSKSK